MNQYQLGWSAAEATPYGHRPDEPHTDAFWRGFEAYRRSEAA